MKSRASAALLIACVAAVGLVQAASVQDVALRYRWTKGDTQQYRVQQESAVTMSNVPGMGEMNITTTITQMLEYSVADVAADGTGTVRVKFAAMKMGMNSPMGSMVWDSASPNAATDPISQMMAKSLSPLVGETITMSVSPAGAVSKIEGLAPIIAKINAGMAGAQMQMPGMNSLMTEDSMRSMLEQSFAGLPERPVKVGESWSKDNTVKMPFGTMTSAARLALQNVANGVATITYKATNKVSVDSSAIGGGMNMSMGDGATDGEMAFDVKAGRIQKSTLRTTQPMTMNTTGPDGAAVSMNATTRTTMTVELVK
jgi:hypothetical protein